MPTLATTSRASLAFKPEATFGTTPGTGNSYECRFTSDSLKYEIATDTSKEIRDDRQITDLIQLGASATGAVGFELSYGSHDDLLQAVLQGTWSAIGTNGEASITGTFTANTLTASSGTPFANLVAGQWFRITGASNSQNNGYFKCVSATSTVITVATGTWTVEGPTASLKVQSARLKNGTTQRSFSAERSNADITQFELFTGLTASKLSLNFGSRSILTGSIDFMGVGASQDTTTGLPGTVTAAPTGAVMNATSNLSNILEGGSALTSTYLKSLSINVDNGLRAQDAIGNMNTVGFGAGTCNVSGSIEAYFADVSLYTKFVNGTATSLSWRVVDSTGAGYIVTLPNVKYSGGDKPTGGINQDVMLNLQWQALRDSSTGATIIIDRVGGALTPWA